MAKAANDEQDHVIEASATTRRLAGFVVAVTQGDIPAQVLHQGKRCLINTVAVSLHATADPAFAAMLSVLRDEGGQPRASVLGTGERTTLQGAAMANGLLAHLDDYDDTFFPTVLHPSAPTIPAALALSEHARLPGREFLAASVLGLEACCRVALAIQAMRHGALWHMTGAAGVFGSAAAAGRLLGLDAAAMASAFGLAGTQAGGLRETFGTMTKAFHPARAAQSGVLAALLTQRGFTCTSSILEGVHGFANAFAAGTHDLSVITDRLGDDWQVMNNAPKPYASAILSHPLVDAMLALRQRPGARLATRIDARVNPLAIKLESRPHPGSGLEGRLSFQHAMAAALIDGQCLPAQFTDERVADAEVAAVRNRIHAIEDAAIGQDQCEVTLTLADGQMLMYRVDHATGSPDRPMTDTQLEAKFHALAGSVLTPARASRLLDVLWHVEDLGDVAEILALCRTGGGSTGLQRPARHPRGARRPAKAVIAD